MALSPKAFHLLVALLERHPAAISRAELDDALWPDVAVGYTSLAGTVTELRKALGEQSAQPLLLRTVRSFGHAFCGETSEEGATRAREMATFPRALVWGGHEIGLRSKLAPLG